jgi:putative FmdB family regulatory protein
LSPAYDYKCQDCGMTLTIVRGIVETEHKPICINCKKVMPRTYDTAPAIQFKGGGWAGKES